MKHGRIHFSVKFLYRDPEREGRKLKIKESSKGRFVIRARYTSAIIYTEMDSAHTDMHLSVSLYINISRTKEKL